MMRDMTKYTCHQSESESERTSIYSSLRFLVGYENLSSESDAIRKEKQRSVHADRPLERLDQDTRGAASGETGALVASTQWGVALSGGRGLWL